MAITVSTDRLISSTEARRTFGKILDAVAKDETQYFVILDNGKVAGVLGNQNAWERKKIPTLSVVRKDWDRHAAAISAVISKLSKRKKQELPRLFR